MPLPWERTAQGVRSTCRRWLPVTDPDLPPPTTGSAGRPPRYGARGTARRALAAAASIGAVVVLLLFLWHARQVLLLGFAGVLLAIFFRRLAASIAAHTPLGPRGALPAALRHPEHRRPVLSALPAVVLGLAQGPQTALWVAALYLGVQIVESYVLAPIIDRRTIYLPPALTVLAQLTLAAFAGLLGVALATPLVAALVVLVTMLYVQDVLGRHDVRVRSH